MKSVRLGEDLEAQLRRAAEAAHVSESEIIRRAVAGECARVLETTIYDQIKDLVGSVSGRGRGSKATDEEIASGMAADAARSQRVIAPRS